jgi:hypothetical protein
MCVVEGEGFQGVRERAYMELRLDGEDSKDQRDSSSTTTTREGVLPQ